MTTAEDVIQLAAREIGNREWPPESDLTKYGEWYGMNGVDWCAIFVSYCFYNAGLPLPATISKGFAYCPFGADWFKSQGKFFTQPKVGDVVFYDWHPGTLDSDAWHIGIVEAINNDGSITAIEGNTSTSSDGDGGQVMRRIRYPELWYGFGSPNYSGVRNPALPNDYPQWPGRYITLTSPYVQGVDVQTWKLRMKDRGWDFGLSSENVFDRRAYEVLCKFQEEKGFEVDGVIGPISWNAAWELPVTP